MIKPGSSKAYAQVNQQNLISHTLQKRQSEVDWIFWTGPIVNL